MNTNVYGFKKCLSCWGLSVFKWTHRWPGFDLSWGRDAGYNGRLCTYGRFTCIYVAVVLGWLRIHKIGVGLFVGKMSKMIDYMLEVVSFRIPVLNSMLL